tara:strand:- start:183 stop:779 length:597 start_codon:yes stop_codon:yes gene_type:complete
MKNNTNKNINKNINKNTKKNKFTNKQFYSGDGMLTSVWGPSMWHYLHIMSFNYPINPSKQEKKNYKEFILNLQYVLPCKHCRINLKNNFKNHPLQACHLKNRATFSRYIYKLHEIINKMLNKKSGLTYCQVRERYEHFRSRCTEKKPKIFNFKDTMKNKEKGCTEPLYGKKAKCVIKIVPQDEKCDTLQIDKKCIKTN